MERELLKVDKHDFLCVTWHLSDIAGTADVVQTWRKLIAEHPGHAFLFILDDFHQACYTSMHARGRHDLDSTEGQDLSHLPAACFEDGQHLSYFTTPEELPLRIAAFERGLAGVTLQDVRDRGVSLFGAPEDEEPGPFEAGSNLLTVMDEPHWLFQVPVAHGYQALYAFPNGYFNSDLNPFENHVLAKHLEEQYGYVLIGIGASRLAYIKTRTLDESAVAALMADLQSIYRDAVDADRLRELEQAIRELDVLVLRYTE